MSTEAPKILVLARTPDETRQIETIAGLSESDVNVVHAATVTDALIHLKESPATPIVVMHTRPFNGEAGYLQRIDAEKPQAPIIVVGDGPDETFASEAFAHGAQSYLVLGRDNVAIRRVLKSAVDNVARSQDLERAEERLRCLDQQDHEDRPALNSLASTVFETTSEAIMVTDPWNRILSVNPAFTRITGYAESEILGKDPSILSSGRHDKAFYRSMWDSLAANNRWEGEIWNRRKDGQVFPEWLTLTAVKHPDGSISHYVAVFSDISERKQAEEERRRHNARDALTHLPNRAGLYESLNQATAAAKATGGQVSVLLVDLDRFGNLNDSYGNHGGDGLLRDIGARLVETVDGLGTVARVGGDEFAIVITNVQKRNDVETFARHLLHRLAEPFFHEGELVYVTGSMGITMYPTDGHDGDVLLRNAETAMRRAKSDCRNSYRFYQAGMSGAVAGRCTKLETGLRHALKRGEFSLHYQPLVDNANGRIIGAEALLRWNHPELGLVRPDHFIPLAEHSGLIVDIGAWVLRTACAQAKWWIDLGLVPFRISVNVSGRQIRAGNLVETVQAALDETGLPPDCLVLEITESLLMENMAETLSVMHQLASLGVSLSLDDFGTGYSSLSYLKRFPVAALKIDRSFVTDVASDESDRAIVSAIIALAHTLSCKVVGEGVETTEQLVFLGEAGCDSVQGYLYGRPVPSGEFQVLLEDNLAELNRLPA